MIYTSYFAKLRELPSNIIPVAICGKAPDGYHGLQYKKLAPKYEFFSEWKKTHDNDYYIRCFNEQVLEKTNMREVMNDIWDLLAPTTKEWFSIYNCPFWRNLDLHIVLVCYEKPEEFCHRHLVAAWLTEHGIPVEEFQI